MATTMGVQVHRTHTTQEKKCSGPNHKYGIRNYSVFQFYSLRHGLPNYTSMLEFPVVFTGERHCVLEHSICSI